MSLLRLPVSLLRALRSNESKEAEAEAEEEDGQARQVARRARMLGWQEMQCDATAKQV
jgi:hypothetical protein